jgi:membrane-associated phospholipid phosphatase
VLASAAFLTEDQAGYAGFMGHGFLEDGARVCDGAFGLPLLGGAGLLWAGGALADADGPEETGRMLTEGLLMTYGATAFLKLAFSRTRPDGDDHGFPSAHSAGTTCVAVILWDRYGPGAGIPAAAVAGFTALSRVTLGKHYPSDVIAGAAIGISFGLAVAEAYRDDGSGTGLPSLSLRWDTENGLGVGF